MVTEPANYVWFVLVFQCQSDWLVDMRRSQIVTIILPADTITHNTLPLLQYHHHHHTTQGNIGSRGSTHSTSRQYQHIWYFTDGWRDQCKLFDTKIWQRRTEVPMKIKNNFKLNFSIIFIGGLYLQFRREIDWCLLNYFNRFSFIKRNFSPLNMILSSAWNLFENWSVLTSLLITCLLFCFVWCLSLVGEKSSFLNSRLLLFISIMKKNRIFLKLNCPTNKLKIANDLEKILSSKWNVR